MYRAYDDTPPHIRRLQAKEDRTIALYEDPGCYGMGVSYVNEATSEPETFEEWTSYMNRMETKEQREGEEY